MKNPAIIMILGNINILLRTLNNPLAQHITKQVQKRIYHPKPPPSLPRLPQFPRHILHNGLLNLIQLVTVAGINHGVDGLAEVGGGKGHYFAQEVN